MRRAAEIVAVLVLLACPATAQPRPELNGPTQGDLNEQASARYQIADRQLNETYRRLMAKATVGGRERLQESQRAWLRFREANCEALTGSHDGSVYPMVLTLCFEGMTDARTKELNGQLHCEEGNLSCGGPFDSQGVRPKPPQNGR